VVAFGATQTCTSCGRLHAGATFARVFPLVVSTDPQIDFALAPQADVALGVFETVLVEAARARELRRHLERLAASVRVLYGVPLPDGLEAQVADAAAEHALARLRVDVVPGLTGPPTVRIDCAALDPDVVAPADVALVTVRVVAGFGPHKLVDRGWLEQIEEAAGEEVRPLLCSPAGALLETTRANVFLLRDGELATPPLDGSILPGVMRAVLLEQARRLDIAAHERPLRLDDLRAADVVLLSGSLRLLERARSRPGRRSDAAAARLMQALGVRHEARPA
jgi:para-aminobenzoate synthetase / 4-amino-4-deoxychorismate lyase